MSPNNSRALLVAGILALTIALVALIAWGPWRDRGQVDKDGSTPPVVAKPSAEQKQLVDAARKAHQAGDWAEATKAWQTVIDSRPPAAESIEAEENLRIVEEKLNPKQKQLTERALPEDPKKRKGPRPKPVSDDDVQKYYPPGKMVLSEALLSIEGKGHNTAFFIRGEVQFLHVHLVLIETKVVRHDGRRIIFEQSFPEVRQLRAVSKQSFSFDPPQWLKDGWRQFEQRILRKQVPHYEPVKDAADALIEAFEVEDYVARSFAQALTFDGQGPEVELVSKVSALAGQRLEFTYSPGLGVILVKVLDGQAIGENDLERLAYNAGPLMDLYLGKIAKQSVGTQDNLSINDIGLLVPLGYDVDVTGTLQYQRDEDRDGLAQLSIVEGKIEVTGNVSGIQRRGSLTPRSGTVSFQPDKFFVKDASAEWDLNAEWWTTDHLLFGTEGVRDMTVKTRYSAQRVDK